ncbi:MAG: hypothetical protein U0414_30720 [Polyangiaceae bacterium]
MLRSSTRVAALALGALALSIGACSDPERISPAGGGGGAGGGRPLLTPPDLPRTETEATLAPKRKACSFQKGAWPAETIGTDFRSTQTFQSTT